MPLPPLLRLDEAVAILDKLDEMFAQREAEEARAGQLPGTITALAARGLVRHLRDQCNWLARQGGTANPDELASVVNHVGLLGAAMALASKPIQPQYE